MTTEHVFDDDAFARVAQLFKALAHPIRARVLWMLSERGPTSAGVLGDDLHMEQSALSHQLKVLRQHRLVRASRRGREVHYALLDDHVQHIVRDALLHVIEPEGGIDVEED